MQLSLALPQQLLQVFKCSLRAAEQQRQQQQQIECEIQSHAVDFSIPYTH